MIKNELDPRVRACLIAERTLYIAREGRFDRARETVQDLREQFKDSIFLELVIWLCLLDGIILFYEKPDSDAFDRIRRSYQLSRFSSTSKVGVLSAAWLSHLEFNRSNVLESALLSFEALRCASGLLSSSLSRIALTIADTFSYCGDWVEASEWYSRSRQQALIDGDRLGVSAVLHNVATLRVHALSLSKFCGMPEPPKGTWIELDLDSSRNYDSRIALLALSSLEPIVRAQLLILCERFDEALPILEVSIHSLKSDGLIRYQAIILADQFLCKSKLSILQDLNVGVTSILEALVRTTDHDDRALVFGLLSSAFGLTENQEQVCRFRNLAIDEVAKYRARTKSLLEDSRVARLGFKNWIGLYGGG